MDWIRSPELDLLWDPTYKQVGSSYTAFAVFQVFIEFETATITSDYVLHNPLSIS